MPESREPRALVPTSLSLICAELDVRVLEATELIADEHLP
jgi:hypothetical protein